MALWFDLKIGTETVGAVEIRRREHLDLTDPAAIADVWSTYDVRRDGRLVGQVRHVYGHGAWQLLALATSLLAEDAEVSASPATLAAEPPTRRLRACVEVWPDAETGEYNPACCRFPKSCSATVYNPETVADADLEPAVGVPGGAHVEPQNAAVDCNCHFCRALREHEQKAGQA